MSSLRPIAIYLPQFHPIPENNEWWGEGFTEWTNVVKATPFFPDHYQPHLPADLGFYDLRLPEVRQAQADMAKEYGIYGFCYYHYWFNGKRLLERPAEEMLLSEKPDFPFMFCWANENWSRTWDGSDHVILMKQEYSTKDATDHCASLIKYFNDPRYIRVDGKPVFAFYKTQIIPDAPAYITAFRAEARKHNIELYILRFQDHNDAGTEILKFVDATVEFQPQSEMLAQYWIQKRTQQFRTGLLTKIYNRVKYSFADAETRASLAHQFTHHLDYGEYVRFILKNYRYPSTYKRFPGVTPMWDNTARRAKKSFLLRNSTPELYQEWLRFHVEHFVPPGKEENFIFINAWNEWAEGNHLEPDQKWGRSYLKATLKALEGVKP